MRLMFCIAAAFGAGCSSATPMTVSPPSSKTTPIVITIRTDERALKAAVGKWVRVKGIVADDKRPEIAGVSVETPGAVSLHTLWGKQAWAEGVLVSEVVRPQDLDDSEQNRGPGTFYHLRDPATGKPAIIHLVEPGR